MKKRQFLLLEVLVALTLIALTAPFLMRLPIQHYRAQLEELESYERDRLADLAFAEVKELLLKNAIAWEKLPAHKQKNSFTLPAAWLELPHFPKRHIERSFALQCVGEKQGKNKELYRLYAVQIFLDGKKYKYKLLVQKILRTP